MKILGIEITKENEELVKKYCDETGCLITDLKEEVEEKIIEYVKAAMNAN